MKKESVPVSVNPSEATELCRSMAIIFKDVFMKRGDLKEELRRLDNNGLKTKLESFRKELISLRFNTSTAHIKDYSQFKKLRSNIALAQTLLKEMAFVNTDNKGTV